jgi:2-(1,2-epoxy-1,2-dihydrophenyl)acetyl-CoA isomerase
MSGARTQLAIEDGVAHLRLVRADAGNAIDWDMVASLDESARAALEPGAARALLITADGPTFTVGGDLAHFGAKLDDLSGELERLITTFHSTLGMLAESPIPIVTGARGPAAGGGLGLMWVADVVIAGDDLKVATGFSKLGLSGDGASSWYLPRLVGMRRAQELLVEGRVLDAEEALEWGLVSRVVPGGEVESQARSAAGVLAKGPTVGLARIRELIWNSGSRTIREHLQAELEAMAATGATADAAEGVSAFLERRRPEFRGG